MRGYLKKMMRIILVAASMVVMTMVMMLPASAHVTIDPDEAPKGSYGLFSLRVPNESDTESTIKLEIQFPKEHPIASVRTTQQDGWDAIVTKTKAEKETDSHGETVDEIVSAITWQGGTIKPGEFAEFHISMGALPDDTDMLEFKALQTYSDGTVVRWIDETPKSGEEPEHPAPTLTLTKATGDEHSSAHSVEDASTDHESEKHSNTVAYIGVGIGAVALLIAFAAILKKK